MIEHQNHGKEDIRLERYLDCLKKDELNFYYKHHEAGKHVVHPEEII